MHVHEKFLVFFFFFETLELILDALDLSAVILKTFEYQGLSIKSQRSSFEGLLGISQLSLVFSLNTDLSQGHQCQTTCNSCKNFSSFVFPKVPYSCTCTCMNLLTLCASCRRKERGLYIHVQFWKALYYIVSYI